MSQHLSDEEKRTITEEPIITSTQILHLLFQVKHALQQKYECSLASAGLPKPVTGPRLRVLMEIAADGDMRMNELAKKLGIKARTVTQFIDALEKDELILRIPDPLDRRAIILQLTERAKPLIQKAKEVNFTIAEQLIEPLSPQQRAQFVDILQTLQSCKKSSGDKCSE
ncbi:MarR family transcriptional regulator [Aminipila butyrica]|uniref:MarR family transcriptional regulator n=1 Tax=Aminipila butyrica TaxID=433296 RepID=A0A858BUH5_9FIRM|nr:MarR family transcriptional regulator [Aminipila butyrica]QIB68738.1 MarR family transcriptional regulator [Aminipila butyrica]